MDSERNRWSRSPSPKYKSAKRKSVSPRKSPPVPPRRFSPDRRANHTSRERTYPKPCRSPPPSQSATGTTTLESRRYDASSSGNHRSRHGNHHHREPRPVDRRRSDRDRSSNTMSRRTEEPRARTKSNSPTIRKEHSTSNKSNLKDEFEHKQADDSKVATIATDNAEEEKGSPWSDDDGDDKATSSDSESSNEAAIDLFASDDSESENEGRFKCRTSTNTKPVASFSSKPSVKANLSEIPVGKGDLLEEIGGHRGHRNSRLSNRHRDDKHRHRNSMRSGGECIQGFSLHNF